MEKDLVSCLTWWIQANKIFKNLIVLSKNKIWCHQKTKIKTHTILFQTNKSYTKILHNLKSVLTNLIIIIKIQTLDVKVQFQTISFLIQEQNQSYKLIDCKGYQNKMLFGQRMHLTITVDQLIMLPP